MNKRLIIIGGILLIIIIALCLIFTGIGNSSPNVNNDGENGNITQDGFAEIEMTQKIDGLVFSNVRIEMLEDMKCEVTADVLNTKDEIEEAHTIRIKVTNETGSMNEVFAGSIASIPSGSIGKLMATVRKDVTDATKVTFEIIE